MILHSCCSLLFHLLLPTTDLLSSQLPSTAGSVTLDGSALDGGTRFELQVANFSFFLLAFLLAAL